MKQQFRTPAAKAANNYFKQAPEKVATDYEKAQQAFHANRTGNSGTNRPTPCCVKCGEITAAPKNSLRILSCG